MNMVANIAYSEKMSRYQAVYVGKPPWHGLGTVVDAALTPQQALEVAGTAYTVDKAPLYARIGDRYVEMPDHRATYRTDTGDIFGPVSADYRVIQNLTPMQMLAEIVRTGEAGIVAHFALGRGERLAAVLDLKSLTDIKIPGDPSKHDAYLCAQWWHNGTGALTFTESLVRIDCQNMADANLAYATRTGKIARVIHTGDTTSAVEQARRTLGFAEQDVNAFVKLMSVFNDVAIPSPTWIEGFTERLIPIEPEAERPVRRLAARETIAALYAHSSNMVGLPFTAYRAFNAVTEYADHYRSLYVADEALVPAKRFTAAMGGSGARLKDTALRLLQQEFEVKVG
jgi:phage/plasmid-like protein (TIGR03299 family)